MPYISQQHVLGAVGLLVMSSLWVHCRAKSNGGRILRWSTFFEVTSNRSIVAPVLFHLSASERLSYLHWLPIHYQIQFKIATLTYKTLPTWQPSYLYSLLQVYHPSRALRSSTQQLLHVPYMSTDFGWRTFSYSSPATWNSIPISTPLKTVKSLTL